MTTDGRPKSKTETIVKRTVNVYLPTSEMKETWKEIAEKSDQSISKFIIEHVTNFLNSEKRIPVSKRGYNLSRTKRTPRGKQGIA